MNHKWKRTSSCSYSSWSQWSVADDVSWGRWRQRRCWGPDSSRLLKPCRIFHWPPIHTSPIIPLHPHPAPHLQQFQYISSSDSAAHCQFVSGSIRLSSMFCRIDFLVSAWLILDFLSSSLLSEGVCSATCNLLVPCSDLVHHWLGLVFGLKLLAPASLPLTLLEVWLLWFFSLLSPLTLWTGPSRTRSTCWKSRSRWLISRGAHTLLVNIPEGEINQVTFYKWPGVKLNHNSFFFC